MLRRNTRIAEEYILCNYENQVTLLAQFVLFTTIVSKFSKLYRVHTWKRRTSLSKVHTCNYILLVYDFVLWVFSFSFLLCLQTMPFMSCNVGFVKMLDAFGITSHQLASVRFLKYQQLLE